MSYSIRRVIALCALNFFGGAAFADGAPLLRASAFVESSQEGSILSSAERAQLVSLRARPTTRRATVVTIDDAALLSDIATIAIPGDGILKAKKSREDRRGTSDVTWIGKTDTGGEVTITASGTKIYAIVRDAGRVFEIRSLGSKFHVLVEVDLKGLPPDHPPGATH